MENRIGRKIVTEFETMTTYTSIEPSNMTRDKALEVMANLGRRSLRMLGNLEVSTPIAFRAPNSVHLGQGF